MLTVPLTPVCARPDRIWGPNGLRQYFGQSDDDVAQLATLVVDAKSARLKYADFVI